MTTSSTPKPRQPDIGYIPTNPELVKAVLLLAEVTADDILYDLGSSDRRPTSRNRDPLPIQEALKMPNFRV